MNKRKKQLPETNSLLVLEQMKTEIIQTSFCDCFEIISGDLSSEFARKAESTPEFTTYKIIFDSIRPAMVIQEKRLRKKNRMI